MSQKSDLKKKIAEKENEIENLEKKRMRSQSDIIEAQVNNVAPNPSDIEYFKVYSELIRVERENLRQLMLELEGNK